MKNLIIDNYDFWNMKPERYWSLPKSKDPKTEIPNLVFGLDYIAARKMDGQWGMIIKDVSGSFHLRARSESVNGGYADKVEWIPHIIAQLKDIPNETVLVGEIYIPSHEGSKNVTKIMGCLKDKSLKRQEDDDWKVHFYCFDCLAIGGHNIMGKGLEERVENLRDLELDQLLRWGNYIERAQYHEGQELWDYIGEVLEQGGEGVVLQKRNSPYAPGKRTAWKTCKVKKEIGNDLDLFFTGRYKPATQEYQGKELPSWTWWQHERTGEKMEGYYYEDFKAGATIMPVSKGWFYDWAGSIELGAVDKDGKIIPIAWISNLTEDVKERVTTGEMDKQVVKVTCMEIFKDENSKKYTLRHAKIVEYRDDKDWSECNIEQLY